MMSKIKGYIAILTTIIALLSSGYAFISKIKKDALIKENASLEDELIVKTKETITYQNKLGQIVTKTYEYQKTIKDLKHSKDSIERRLYKVAKANKTNLRKLNSISEITSKTESVAYVDTTYIVKHINKDTTLLPIKYENKFIEAIAYKDSLKYTVFDSLAIFESPRMIDRNFFLWKWIGWKKKTDRDMVEVVNYNPDAAVKVQKIKIRKR